MLLSVGDVVPFLVSMHGDRDDELVEACRDYVASLVIGEGSSIDDENFMRELAREAEKLVDAATLAALRIESERETDGLFDEREDGRWAELSN